LIIIEGCDLVGKTTLAKHIEKRFQASYKHVGLPVPPRRHWDDVVDHLSNDFGATVYDRLCLGSIVYGKLLHDEPNKYPVNEREFGQFLQVVQAENILLIMASANETVIRTRYRQRGDTYLSLENILQAKAGYEQLIQVLMKNQKITMLHYNSGLFDCVTFSMVYEFEIRMALKENRRLSPPFVKAILREEF
jgi:hypothetical protein